MERERIGILGSSMDPFTIGHRITAQEILTRRKLDKIIFLPSSSKRSDKTPHISDEHRVNMAKLAIKDNPRFEFSDYEMNKNAWDCYTYHTMEHFKEVYPNAELFFLMGADILADLPTWKYGFELIANNKFIVIQRKVKNKDVIMHEIINEHKLLRQFEDHFDLLYKGVANETSSSYIRDEFEIGNNPRYYLPEEVFKYIIKNKLYIPDCIYDEFIKKNMLENLLK